MHTHRERENKHSCLPPLTRRAIWRYFGRCVHRQPTHTETHMQSNTTQKRMRLCTQTAWWQKRHYLKWNIWMPHIANWLWSVSTSMPSHFLFFLFLFIPQFPLHLHWDNLEKSTKLGMSPVWFISHKSLKISTTADAWLIAAANMQISKNMQWGIRFIICLRTNITPQ